MVKVVKFGGARWRVPNSLPRLAILSVRMNPENM